MSSKNILSSFIEGAPPGELTEVTANIRSLFKTNPKVIDEIVPAFVKTNEDQFATVKPPGCSREVIISAYNSLGNGRYYDIENSKSFAFTHVTQEANDVQDFKVQSSQLELVNSISSHMAAYIREHFPKAVSGVYPTDGDSKIAIVLVANKYSPHNYWNGRWRSSYIFDPSANNLHGTTKVDVHYYEDGNVRLLTEKPMSETVPSGMAQAIVKVISTSENQYQDELNRGFVGLCEGSFKNLRRQLPVTRQKIEWDKVASYRLGQEIGGGSLKRA